MTFTRPEALLLAAVAVVIVLLYLLHPRTIRWGCAIARFSRPCTRQVCVSAKRLVQMMMTSTLKMGSFVFAVRESAKGYHRLARSPFER